MRHDESMTPPSARSADAMQARAELKAGLLRGRSLRERILGVPAFERDAWVDELLGLPPPPEDEALPRGAAPYLPAPVDAILTATEEAPLDAHDVFVDVGSGLGRVVFLAHLLTGAEAHGVEIQASLVRKSRALARELGLTGVSFSRADVSDLALEGTVFFLYSPLTGEPLRRVLHSLSLLARRQPIVVCAVGLELDGETWLRKRASSNAEVSFYDGS